MNNFLSVTIRKILELLSKKQKIKGALILALVILSGVFDVLGLAAILPVIYMAADPEIIKENEYIFRIYTYLNFSTINSFLLFSVSIVFLIFLIKNIFYVFTVYTQSKFSYSIAEDLAKNQYKAYYSMPYIDLKKFNSNTLVNNIASVSMEFSSIILNQTYILISEVFIILLIVIGIAIIDYKLLLLLCILLLPVTFFFYKAIKNTISRLGIRKNDLRIKTYQTLYQSFHGYVDIKINNKENFFSSSFFNVQHKYFKTLVKQFFIGQLPTKVIEMAALTGIVIIFIYALLFNNNPAQLISFLALFTTAAYRLMPSLNRILSTVIQIKGSFYVFDILKEIKEIINDIRIRDDEKDTKYIEALSFNKEIVIDKIFFSYKNEDSFALQNINLKINKGEKIGFIGASGSGKTTLFNILLRLIKEDTGEILIDGKPLTPSSDESWRAIIGYVRQDYYLTDNSLAENIALGEHLEEIDKNKLNSAIKAASLGPLLDQLSDGIYSSVGEHGGNLSGGQRQRIAIARALYKNAQILLFDEATSALDNETEKEIMDTINQISNDKTILIIAHRITTLKGCDRIYELKDGNINRVLTYRELIDSEIEVS